MNACVHLLKTLQAKLRSKIYRSNAVPEHERTITLSIKHTSQPQLPIQWGMEVLFSKHSTQLSSNAIFNSPKKTKRCMPTSSPVSWILDPLTYSFHDLLRGPAELLAKEGYEKRAENTGSLYVHLIKIRCPRHVSEFNKVLLPPASVRLRQNLIQQAT